jgi:hypothetical protein
VARGNLRVHQRRRSVLGYSVDMAEAASEDIVIMKTTLAILVLGSLALMTSGANAYQSKANGYQSYPNYDRQEYQNRSCCSWKSKHKAQHKPIKH